MAIKRKRPKKNRTAQITTRTETVKKETDVVVDTPLSSIESRRFRKLNPRNLIIIAFLVLAFLGWRFKNLLIAATVNGQLISRFELNEKLNRRFGKQMLEEIVNERLLVNETRQKGIYISPDQINEQIKQVEEKIKGQTSLSEALSAQGLSNEDFRRQIEIQLAIEKLFEKEATLSAKEVDDYITQNSKLYKDATDQAKVREEVSQILKRQKISDLFEKWFTELKNKASLKIFL